VARCSDTLVTRSGERMSEADESGGTSGAGTRAGADAASPVADGAIPWQQRLSTKLLGLIGALTVVGVAIFALGEARMGEYFLESQAGGAALFSHTIQNAILRAMLEERRPDAYETMRDVARQDGVEKVRLISKGGLVAFSTQDAEVGTTLTPLSEPCAPCHAQGVPAEHASLLARTRVFQRNGHRVLKLVTPIYNEERCSSGACHAHPTKQRVLGVLDVQLSLAPVDARIAAFRRGTLGFTAVGALLVAAILFAFARSQIVRPVSALVAGTRKVAVDELDEEIRVDAKGELGVLAGSLNNMIRALRRMERELRDVNVDLEHQVEERTADLKKAHAALVQSEKLSSLGRLAASIAHEINNPLAGILTFAKLVIRTLEGGPPDEATRQELVRNLRLVQRETERCTTIVRSLLDFARDRPLALRDVSPNAAVEEALQLIGHQIAMQGITLEKRLGAVPTVIADFGQLRQAVVNVAMNACEAMGRGGKLTVETRCGADGGVEIHIADTGPGISEDHMSHLFEPFFTTKGEKGTGLGLSVVYGVVQRHHGRVEVHSEPGRGARFTLCFPPVAPAQIDPPRGAAPARVAAGVT
jgi:two-component system, NtrC family, sensor kinase